MIAREQKEGIWSSTKVVSLLGSNFIDVYVHVYENLHALPTKCHLSYGFVVVINLVSLYRVV